MSKKVIRITDGDLKEIIKESVKVVLKEYNRDIDMDNYYGGGLPDKYFDNDDVPDSGRITQKELTELNSIAEAIYNIANNTSDDASLLYQAAHCLDEFISKHKQ